MELQLVKSVAKCCNMMLQCSSLIGRRPCVTSHRRDVRHSRCHGDIAVSAGSQCCCRRHSDVQPAVYQPQVCRCKPLCLHQGFEILYAQGIATKKRWICTSILDNVDYDQVRSWRGDMGEITPSHHWVKISRALGKWSLHPFFSALD